ncbi:gluconokinase [Massilia pinisoli]|uniref:Gluconokinase n=1 Tax=Massilia pinisoli TaxID=1772194 RepID=A0ABT1ZY81_9BURK|nr:gluconokinase [Massilia pinisoli]MCS0584885.1 gluconokinase [Massilia pinisoli]
MAPPSDIADQPGNGRRWVIMGVCGCGKSTVGAALAQAFGVAFIEGDAYHPAPNVIKMSAGEPLTDDDRAGWLQALAREIGAARARGEGIVVSCSALKRRYRDLLRQADPDLRFAHLQGPRGMIAARMQTRIGHYMPISLLDSQLRDLEPLQPGEAGLTLDTTQPPDALVASIIASTHRKD